MSSHDWQHQTEVSRHWHDPNPGNHFVYMGNQYVQQLPQLTQTPQTPPPSNYCVTKENSINWSNDKHAINDTSNWTSKKNDMTNQWQNQNREIAMSNQFQQPVQAQNTDSRLNTWAQSGNINLSQDWQQGNLKNDMQTNQWLQQSKEDNIVQDFLTFDNDSVRFPKNDRQQIQSFSGTSISESTVNTQSNSEKQGDHTKYSFPSANTVLSNDSFFPMQTKNSMNLQVEDPHNSSAMSESKLPFNKIETANNKEKTDFDFNEDTEWNTVTGDELSTGLYQLHIDNKSKKHLENPCQSMESHPEDWTQQVASSFNVTNSQNNNIVDNVPMPSTDYVKSIENSHVIDSQAVAIHEHATPDTYQTNNLKTSENMVQSGFDQWYNQSTVPPPLEKTWYSKDYAGPSKQWVEQNVENYENIQQSSEFINSEVIAPALQKRDIYGSRDSINKETLDNDPKMIKEVLKGFVMQAVPIREYRQDINNIEVPSTQHIRVHQPVQAEQTPDNYEFASNDRNTFLETGELTDSHQEHESSPPSQDDENDEVPNDIPFLREVPGQSSSMDPRRNDPTGQEQYVQSVQRHSDPRRNDPSGQEQTLQIRNIYDRSENRDVPPGQERSISMLPRSDSDTLERRNDPSGRERSLPPQQSRNDPSGEERYQTQSQIMLEPSEVREIPGRGNEPEEIIQQSDGGLRQIPGGASPNEVIQSSDDRANGRVVTGSQEVPTTIPSIQDQGNDLRNKREEAVGASGGNQSTALPPVRKDSYEDEDEEGSGNSREDSRERRREISPERRRYEYTRKNPYYDRDRECDDDYYYEQRRGGDNDRSYTNFERREISYRDDDRKHHNRDDLDRHRRDEVDRRGRGKDDLDDRDGRRRPDDRRRDRGDDPRRRDRETRDYDSRYPRDREYLDRDRRRDDRRPRRYEDYDIRESYRREYYEDPYSRSSRPSSRSSYNDRDREYYMRSRDPYYAYNGYAGYDYGPHYNNNYYAYLENLRRTNPAAYAEWYHKYYSSQHSQQHLTRSVNNYPEDRASVHSGRSSCDERTAADKRNLTDMSLLEDSTVASARLTPTKYSTSHVYGCFSIGSLIHVHPSYPADGERAKVDIFRVDNLLLHDPIARDLRAYPGPLIKGVTHKKTIIEYCENKIKKAGINEEMIDRASYILLYELMIMLIQQNGNVVGVDIASLLLRNKDAYPYDVNKEKMQDGRRESVISQRSGTAGVQGSNQDITIISDKNENIKQQKTIEQVTDEFRNTLLYGLVQEALEYAMTEGLWGHALFLASKLDKRTHASVMARFANSLPPHDPLQTLYQLHSGRIPAIVTCVADPKWDDWRPHLAMIISNTSTNPEINRRSITTLGDTLLARGDIYAAHFCYILAQVDFGGYEISNAKLVLIGSNHHKPYSEFMTTEAVMLTEIYEYARNLSEPGFTLVDLQIFKFDLAVRMVDYGLIEKALLYIEQIAVNIVNEPSKYKRSFIDAVYVLGDKIKYHDPICKDSIEDAANLAWLNNLSQIVNKYRTGEIIEDVAYGSQMNVDQRNSGQNQEAHEIKQQQPQQQQKQSQHQQHWNISQTDYAEGPTSMMEVTSTEMQSDWQPLSLPSNIHQDAYDQNMQYTRNNDDCNQYQQLQQQQDYWNQQSYYSNDYDRNDVNTQSNWQQQSTRALYSSDHTETDNLQQQDKWKYETEREEKTPTPEVSNYTLTSDSSHNTEWPLDANSTNTIRRRRVLTTLDRCSSSQIPASKHVSQYTKTLVSNIHAFANPENKVVVPQKIIKYPKITTSYPKILQDNKKIHPNNIKKSKKVDPRYVKPPYSQPPVFLKCNIKKDLSDDVNNEKFDKITLNNSDKTDLDIHISTKQHGAVTMPTSILEEEKLVNTDINITYKKLKQYCNFEEMKVVKVAPHIRRKDVICDTVDAWSSTKNEELFRYKPLIFGGTYPIDLPIPYGQDNYLIRYNKDDINELCISKTYDTDVSTSNE